MHGAETSEGVRAPRVAGILLAAGMSTRMGRNKLLLDLEGEPLVRRAARRALAADLSPLLVVVGHEEERVRRSLSGLACAVVRNSAYATGLASSLRAGFAALPATADAAVVLLADMPFVSTAMLTQVASTYRATPAPLVVSDYAGVEAPPLLFARALFPELLALADGDGARQVARRHRERAIVLPWPAGALADLDAPDDYARVHGAPVAAG